MKDDVLFEAFRNWEELSLTDEKRMVYESRLKKIRDEEAAVIEAELRVQEAREEALVEGKSVGRAEGIAEGKAEGRAENMEEVARNLLDEGFDPKMVAKVTGLDKEMIIKIQKDHK